MGFRPVRGLSERRGWPFVVGATILKPTLISATSRTWRGGENIPATGGCVIALNHLTKVDPLFAAHFLYDHGRIVRYLAKSGLFEVPVLGGFMRAAGQIPVERERRGNSAYAAAVQAVRDGKCVVVYPEGTITRDPELWPMVGKTGAARIALETGCPVIPVAHWGAQEVLAPYAKKPSLLPRKHVEFSAGPPVDLSDLAERRPITSAMAASATERIMAAITEQLEQLRGASAPEQRFDPRRAGVSETGRPRTVDPTNHTNGEESA